MEQEQSQFKGWAVVEIMGHNKEIGFVTTEYFGGPALFRVDQPPLPEREIVLDRPQWIGETYCPVGSTIKREAMEGKTSFVGPSSIFRMTPCSEETAKAAIERMLPAQIKVVHLAEKTAIAESSGHGDDEDSDLDNEY